MKPSKESYTSIIREIFANRNMRVLTLSAWISIFSNSLWQPYRSPYALGLGASKEVLGMLTMIQTSSLLLTQYPGGLLADRIGRKKVIVFFTVFRVLTPIIYLLAPSWQLLIPAMICTALGNAYRPAFTALQAESFPLRGRGAGFGAYRMITSTPNIFTALIGGIVMDSLGLFAGFKVLLVTSSIMQTVVLFIRSKYLTETLHLKEIESKESENLRRREEETSRFSLTELGLSKSVFVLIIVMCISTFAMGLTQEFIIVYAIEVVGLTYTQWGIILMVLNLTSALLSMVGGMVSDNIGRKPGIFIARFVTPITMLGLTYSTGFNDFLLWRFLNGIGTGIGGGGESAQGTGGGPAWQALLTDMIPSSRRGRVMGLMSTLSGIISAPSAWVGGYLWDNYSPVLPFRMSFLIGIISPFIFYLFIKEPKEKHE